jgi:hypothetical protein
VPTAAAIANAIACLRRAIRATVDGRENLLGLQEKGIDRKQRKVRKVMITTKDAKFTKVLSKCS